LGDSEGVREERMRPPHGFAIVDLVERHAKDLSLRV
jgi:hypothetical protein